MRNQYQYF